MYKIVEHNQYKKKRKFVEKLGQLSKLDKTIDCIRHDSYIGSFFDHPLQRTSRDKSG